MVLSLSLSSSKSKDVDFFDNFWDKQECWIKNSDYRQVPCIFDLVGSPRLLSNIDNEGED